jgi:hypothetical protein
MTKRGNNAQVKAAAIKLFNENGRDQLATQQAADNMVARGYNTPEGTAFWQAVALWCWEQGQKS